MTIDRKPIFDTVRDLLGRGFSQSEVRKLDLAIDEALGARAPDESWIEIAAPFIEQWEGYARKRPDGSVEAYPDPGTGGKPWTIGIGSTSDEDGRPIAPGTIWTRERAVARFKAHLREFGEGVDRALDGASVSPRQKAAMASLAYNVGLVAFAGSTLLRKHKAGDYAGAAREFDRWTRAGGRVLRGLVRRRKAERELYESGTP